MMPATVTPDALRPLLKAFDFRTLFTQKLGWERHQAARLVVQVGAAAYTLEAIAEKRGFVVYVCAPGPNGLIPDPDTCRRIDKEVTKTAFEHLIIFVDGARTTQVWQWVRRERGRPATRRPYTFRTGAASNVILDKLLAIRFT